MAESHRRAILWQQSMLPETPTRALTGALSLKSRFSWCTRMRAPLPRSSACSTHQRTATSSAPLPARHATAAAGEVRPAAVGQPVLLLLRPKRRSHVPVHVCPITAASPVLPGVAPRSMIPPARHPALPAAVPRTGRKRAHLQLLRIGCEQVGGCSQRHIKGSRIGRACSSATMRAARLQCTKLVTQRAPTGWQSSAVRIKLLHWHKEAEQRSSVAEATHR